MRFFPVFPSCISSVPTVSVVLAAGCLIGAPAHANNGVMMPAYGAKAMGMGGTSIALPQDATASANNPAGMAVLGDRQDVDLTMIHAPIDLEVGSASYSDTALVPIPAGGFSRVLNDNFSWGISLFGQGVALDYDKPVFGSQKMKSKLQQVQLAPTLTWRMAPGHYLGISPRLAYQRLEIAGLEGFGFNTPGGESAYGAGAAIGYLGSLDDRWSVGLSYTSPVWFQRLDRYRELLPDGRLNLPQQAAAGVAYKATPRLTFAVDALWIDWSSEDAYGNRQLQGGPLGAGNGPGFGWRDQKILRLGTSYDLDRHWTVRAGASLSNHFIDNSQATFASLAPLSQYDHYSIGATYRPDAHWEVTGSYMRAINAELHGTGASTGVRVGTDVDYFNLGVGYRY